LPRLFDGDAATYPSFADAGTIAERFVDPDATMVAQLGRGYALILQGRIADGMALLDEPWSRSPQTRWRRSSRGSPTAR
jgi:hypothetical protein